MEGAKLNKFKVASLQLSSKMVFCAISGEPPQDPVVSVKSGHIYERRLISKYITENGSDPITGDKLEESDLIDLKACPCSFLLSLLQRIHIYQ